MIGGNYGDFNTSLNEIKKVKDKYKDMKGVFVWEYIIAPPDEKDPSLWCKSIKNIEDDFIII